MDNAHIVLQTDNAHPPADDFRVKYETKLARCQSVESDINGLQKVTDDINITQLQLGTETEALKEELVFMKKNHEDEVNGLQNQIASSGLTMELDAPKSQDLSKIMWTSRPRTMRWLRRTEKSKTSTGTRRPTRASVVI